MASQPLVRYEVIHPIQSNCSYEVEGIAGLSEEEVHELALVQKLQNFNVDIQRDEVKEAVQNFFQLGTVEQKGAE